MMKSTEVKRLYNKSKSQAIVRCYGKRTMDQLLKEYMRRFYRSSFKKEEVANEMKFQYYMSLAKDYNVDFEEIEYYFNLLETDLFFSETSMLTPKEIAKKFDGIKVIERYTGTFVKVYSTIISYTYYDEIVDEIMLVILPREKL